jgi:hypothetical protein
MLSLAIIKDFNVLEGGGLHLGMRPIAMAMVPLILEAVKPALRRGIDAPMSRSAVCRSQIGQNERV